MFRGTTPPRPTSRIAVWTTRAAWAFLASGVVATALYALGPSSVRAPIRVGTAVLSIVLTIIGSRWHQSRGIRGPWVAVAGALAAFSVSMALRAYVLGAGAIPAESTVSLIPDLVVVPGYLLLAYAVVEMLRRRRASADDLARSDAWLVGLGAAFVAWIFLIEPRLNSPIESTAPHLTAVFFPVVDVLVLVGVAVLVLADGVRKLSMWLLATSMVTMFTGDLLFAIQFDSLAAEGTANMVIDTLYVIGFVCVGTAALHPSMRTLVEPQPVQVRILGLPRIMGIAAALIAPTALTVVWPPPTLRDGMVRVALAVLLTLTIVIRVVRANNSRAVAERTARHRATHDSLTDLPNRELLADTVVRWCARAAADGQEVSLLFIDLDRFKNVNDSWGHEVGDELLCAVAGRLGGLVRAEDLVCRIGGDEFVIALASTSPSALAESLAQRLLVEFAEPFTLSVGTVVITPSIGVARSNGATEALELIRDADTAMYQAKGSGRNRYALFDSSLRERARNRADLEQALRGALERGELSVHYQPIVDLGTEKLSGFEALMRWTHPQYGAVSPLDFIPIAEDTGLIVDSGAWLLGEAIDQLARWRANPPHGSPPPHMSVNISVRQLRDSALVAVVREALDRTGLPASALWLEITESGMMEDPESSLATLRALRALGLTLSIDDFGTGYSSLSYLKRFPVGIVKIDRSFVAGVGADHDDEAIVRTVVAMAHALGQRVVAEGVETVVQRDWLRGLGCDLAQGWLFGAARPAAEHSAWFRGPHADTPRHQEVAG